MFGEANEVEFLTLFSRVPSIHPMSFLARNDEPQKASTIWFPKTNRRSSSTFQSRHQRDNAPNANRSIHARRSRYGRNRTQRTTRPKYSILISNDIVMTFSSLITSHVTSHSHPHLFFRCDLRGVCFSAHGLGHLLPFFPIASLHLACIVTYFLLYVTFPVTSHLYSVSLFCSICRPSSLYLLS